MPKSQSYTVTSHGPQQWQNKALPPPLDAQGLVVQLHPSPVTLSSRIHACIHTEPLSKDTQTREHGQWTRSYQRVGGEGEHLGGQGWWKSTVINKGRKGPEGGGGHCGEILWTPQVCHHSHLARASPVGTEMSVSHKLSGDTGSLFLLLNWGGVSCGHGPGQQVLTLWAHSRFLIHSWRA